MDGFIVTPVWSDRTMTEVIFKRCKQFGILSFIFLYWWASFSVKRSALKNLNQTEILEIAYMFFFSRVFYKTQKYKFWRFVSVYCYVYQLFRICLRDLTNSKLITESVLIMQMRVPQLHAWKYIDHVQ